MRWWFTDPGDPAPQGGGVAVADAPVPRHDFEPPVDPRLAELRARLDTMPLFQSLTAAERTLVARHLRCERVALGHTIAQEGTRADDFIYVHGGTVRLKRKVQGVVRSIGRRGEGWSCGELALFQPVTWDYTIAAAAPDTIVLRLAGSEPELRRVLEPLRATAGRLAFERALERLAGTDDVDDAWVAALAEQVRLCRFDAGEPVFAQGAEDSSLYYVFRGHVNLLREGVARQIPIGLAEEGDFLGEHGALNGSTQAYHAIAATAATVVEIPQDALPLLFGRNPQVHDRLLANIRSYEEEARRIQDSDAAMKSSPGGDRLLDVDPARARKRIRRFPFLQQHEETDCGAACLTMISEFYGLRLSMGRVRELANVNVAGASMAAVCRAAENLGYRARALKLSYGNLKNLQLPAIVHWEGFHWIVLYGLDARHVWVADPDRGLRKLTHAEFAQGWTGYAIELEPTAALQEVPPDRSPLQQFARYLLPYRKFYFEIFLAALVLNLLGLASPLFLQAIVDSVVVYRDVGLLNLMLLGMLMVSVFATLTSSVQSLLVANISAKLDLRMLADFYRHVLSLPAGFFYSHRISDILSRFGENSRIRGILAGTTITTVLNVLMVFVYLGLMVAYSPSMTVLALIFVPLFIAESAAFTPLVRKLSNDLFRSGNEQSSLMIESIQGIETVKSTAAEWHVRTRWENRWVENVNLGFRMQRLDLLSGVVSTAINTAAGIALLWYGAHLVIQDRMTVGELMAFNALVGAVMGPIMGLVGLWQDFAAVKVSMERVNDVLLVAPEQAPVGSAPRLELPYCKGRIEFRDVDFRYGSEDSPLVIQGASLVIEPGQTVALVGKSGCGKSTLMKMVAGFNLPSAGALLIDGHEITRLDLQSVRRHVGWVLQDSFLFNASVIENIAFGDANPDLERVKEAAELAAADEFIREFAKGYETVIGDKGLMVSGGQRQRICIARALYRRPQILLFDEATSALDAQSERRIQENLQGIFGQGRTAIIIAHRLSTIRHADVIYYLDHGAVVEKGTHDELVALRGRYYAMASQQLGGDT